MLLRGTGHIERIVSDGAAAVAEKAHFEMRLEDGQLNQLLDEWLCNFVCASAGLFSPCRACFGANALQKLWFWGGGKGRLSNRELLVCALESRIVS